MLLFLKNNRRFTYGYCWNYWSVQIIYLVTFEFYTPHSGVLKGATTFLLTLFSISLRHCCTNRYHRIVNLLIKTGGMQSEPCTTDKSYASLSHATNNIFRRMTQAHLNFPPRQVLLACNLYPECSQNDVLVQSRNVRQLSGNLSIFPRQLSWTT